MRRVILCLLLCCFLISSVSLTSFQLNQSPFLCDMWYLKTRLWRNPFLLATNVRCSHMMTATRIRMTWFRRTMRIRDFLRNVNRPLLKQLSSVHHEISQLAITSTASSWTFWRRWGSRRDATFAQHESESTEESPLYNNVEWGKVSQGDLTLLV